MAAVVAMVIAGLFSLALTAASHAAAVLPPTPAPVSEPTASTVTADALPTVQIDGVVWSQAVVGNTVYAGGNFANARPAGAAPGTNQVARTDLLSYDITTGVLNASFAPVLNGQVKTVVASPDGTRVYVGGSFTTVNGMNRYRIAAFSTSTGALITSFAPGINYTVNSIVATNTTVYVGGAFTLVGTTARSRLAAFSASNGGLSAWNPVSDATVTAMVLPPGGSKLIVGGNFQHINSSPAYGLGALDPVTGALLPWAAGNVVRDAGANAAITSLSTDGTAIYGAGYVFGAGGNLEGTFSADPVSGAINWIEDCHGDTYGAYSTGTTVYTISHAHYCATVGGYPQTDANWQINEHHALAFTADARGTLGHNAYGGYTDWYGNPAPSMYNWFPDFTVGTFTGQGQAAWSVTGQGPYVVMGGEFLKVNNTAQQGLVRFATRPSAPGAQGPRVSGAAFVPTVVATSAHSTRVNWQANWDRDNQNLSYKVIRNNNTAAPVYTTAYTSQFWNRPTLGFVDAGLTPGATYTYKVYATDPNGNTTQGDNVSITMPTTSPSLYVQAVLNDGANDYWRLGESSGPTGADLIGSNNLTEGTGVGHGAAGAIVGDSNAASTFDGTSVGNAASTTSIPGPTTFTLEGWIKTTSTSGGKIVGFGNQQTTTSTSYDRHLYMDNTGHVYFGVYVGGVRILSSAAAYNDGRWHYLAASLSSNGMALYVDGALVGTDVSTTSAQPYSGYWRIGGDNLNGWPSQPLTPNFKGSIDDVAVYPTALTSAQVQSHFNAGSGANQAPVAAFAPSCTNLVCSFTTTGSFDPDGSIVSYAWVFGDSTSGSGVSPSHSYGAAGTFPVVLTVTDDKGATATITHSVTVAAVASPTIASDTFGRSVAGGWGAADTGGAWTVAGVAASNFSVVANTGRMQMTAGATLPTAYLNGVSAADSDALVDFTFDKVPTGTAYAYAYLAARHSGTSQYRARVKVLASGVVQLSLTKVVSGTETVLLTKTLSGVTFIPGQSMRLRLQVSGTTSVALATKLWVVGAAEPAAFQVTFTDASTPLGPGGVGLISYVSSAADVPYVASFANFAVTTIASP